jgi:hypothetical protein
MATHHVPEQISEADVQTLGEKLRTWAQELTPAEQAILGRILLQAATASPNEVEGFWLNSEANTETTGGGSVSGGGGSGSTTGDLAPIGGAAAASLLLSTALPAVLPGLVAGTSSAAVAYVYSPFGPGGVLQR